MKAEINPLWTGILDLYDRCIKEAEGNEGAVAVITKRKQEAMDIIEEIEELEQNWSKRKEYSA